MATRQPVTCSRNRGPPRQMRCVEKTRRALRRRLQGDGPSRGLASAGSEAQSKPTMAVRVRVRVRVRVLVQTAGWRARGRRKRCSLKSPASTRSVGRRWHAWWFLRWLVEVDDDESTDDEVMSLCRDVVMADIGYTVVSDEG